jgi:hypothetical protein
MYIQGAVDRASVVEHASLLMESHDDME